MFGLGKGHIRRRKEKKKKKVGKPIGDPVGGRDAPINVSNLVLEARLKSILADHSHMRACIRFLFHWPLDPFIFIGTSPFLYSNGHD